LDEPKIRIERITLKLPDTDPHRERPAFAIGPFGVELVTFIGLWDRFQSKKVIVHEINSHCNLSLNRLPDDLDCLVIRFQWNNNEARHLSYQNYPALKRVVYILPHGTGIFGDCSSARELLDMNRLAMLQMNYAWRDTVQGDKLQMEIVIVHPDASDPEAAQRQENIGAAMKRAASGVHTEPVKQIRFLAMPEYLSTHDWSGEFTEEEVGPWLDLVDVDA
jgi:hypothetical protein